MTQVDLVKGGTDILRRLPHTHGRPTVKQHYWICWKDPLYCSLVHLYHNYGTLFMLPMSFWDLSLKGKEFWFKRQIEVIGVPERGCGFHWFSLGSCVFLRTLTLCLTRVLIFFIQTLRRETSVVIDIIFHTTLPIVRDHPLTLWTCTICVGFHWVTGREEDTYENTLGEGNYRPHWTLNKD